MASDTKTVVDNLVYLSQYLEESRNRVAELEKALASIRQHTLNPGTSARLFALEADKADLQRQVSALEEKLKARDESCHAVVVKKESGDALTVVKTESSDVNVGPGSVTPAPNSALADARQKYRDESLMKDALQAKCAELEAQAKASADLAAKALRERVEAEKATDSIREKYEVLTKQMQDIQGTCVNLQAANEALVAEGNARIALLKEKNAKLKDEKAGSRASFEEQGEKINSLKDKLSQVRGNLKTVKNENEEVKQTLREMIDLVESLQEEVKENADLVKMVGNLSKQCKEAAEARSELEERCTSLERTVAQLEASKMAEVGAKYRDYMSKLPFPEKPPPSTPFKLEPVCYGRINLHGYLSQDPVAKRQVYYFAHVQHLTLDRFLNHVLYLPNRQEYLSDFSYVAYGPTHRYDRTTGEWTEGSDLVGFHGGIRELFVNCRDFIVYAGSYKCHDLRALHPDGGNRPQRISPVEIIDAALGVPRPQHYVRIIKQRFADGDIKVAATGLQCVGFNRELYDSLRRRFAEDRKQGQLMAGGKRKASSADLRNDGKTKFKKI